MSTGDVKREDLIAYFETHNPSNVAEVDKILVFYQGKHQELRDGCQEKYGFALTAAPAPAPLIGKSITFETGPMGMMTKNQDGSKIAITMVSPKGQAEQGCVKDEGKTIDHMPVKIGDVITGINGKKLADCMTSPSDTEELKKMLADAKRPIILNFNNHPGAGKKKPAKPAKPVPPAPKLDPGMEKFKMLMIKGIEVIKHHSSGGGGCLSSKKMEKRILYMDKDMHNIYCGAQKGDPKTKKVYNIHNDITKVRPVPKSSTQIQIVTSKIVKKKPVILTVEVPSAKARNLIVEKLIVLIRHEKAAKQHKAEHGGK